jgi:hypothetical protein
MTDKEMLELAAKAAGIKALRCPNGVLRDCTGLDPAMNIFSAPEWNPLTDDGDAQRLAVKLHIDVNYRDLIVFAERVGHVEVGAAESKKLYPLRPYSLMAVCSIALKADPYAATRQAIVRAAAEIGRKMK